MLYANKRLQQTKLYKEYTTLIDTFYKTSLEKERKQQSYCNRTKLANFKTGEMYQLSHSFEKHYKNYTKSIEQKVYTIEALARKKGLAPVFMTLTLPSEFHPFKSISHKDKRLYTTCNRDFMFNSIETAIKHGYDYLNELYRTFYKRVKNKISELRYIRVIEPHKTMIPHMHILFFIPKSENKILLKEFVKIKNEYELDKTDYSKAHNESHADYKTSINRASKYIMKYITKNLKSGTDIFYARVLDGYKRVNKIRMITTSNLPLSLAEYRTIYYHIDSDIKEALIKEARQKGINLFYLILERLAKVTILTQNRINIHKKYKRLKDSRFIIIKKVIRRTTERGGYSYHINSFNFFIDRELIYKKETLTKIYT